MKTFYSAGRLLWRPAILLALFPLGLVTGLAFWDMPGAAMGTEAANTAARETLWRFATIVPAAVGFLISLVLREVQHTVFAWTLPDLARRLRLAKAVVGGFIAAGVAAAAFSLFDTQPAFAIFGWSALAFALGGVMFDPVLSKLEGRGLGLVVAILGFRPEYVARIMEVQPFLVGGLAILAALVLLRREFSPALTRRRALTFLPPAWSVTHSATRQYWARQATSDSEWSGRLDTGSTFSWITAGAHEAYGARKFGYAGAMSIQVAIAIVASYFTGNVTMVGMFPWIVIGMSGLQLSSRFLYPINRRERATLFFLSTLTESMVAAAAGLIGLGFLNLVGVRDSAGIETSVGEASSFVAYLVALAPISYWAKIRGSWAEQAAGSAGMSVKFFAFHLTFIILASSAAMMTHEFLPGALGVAAALFLVIHTAYWFALHRHFATKDLVLART